MPPVPTEPPKPAPRSPDREVELKLLADPADLPAVAALPPALASLDAGPPVTRRQRTLYFDTPALDLMGRGVALRIRIEQGLGRADRVEQSLKTLSSGTPGDSAAVAVRREWDWPLNLPDGGAAVPDFSLLDAGGAGPLIPADLRPALVPVFETDVTRTTRQLRPDPVSLVELAVDHGAVVAGDHRSLISEVELELRAGSVGRLFDLALALNRAVPVRLATVSKAEMGYALLTGRTPAPALPEPLALSPLTTVAEAFRHIVRHGLRLWLANEACAIAGGDAEGLHQIRVALRRLRVALDLFGAWTAPPEAVAHDLRRLAKRLQPARSWDVVESAAVMPLTALARPPQGLTALAYAVHTLRQPAVERAIAALDTPETTRLVLTLAAWLEGGVWHTAAPADRRAYLDAPMSATAPVWLARLHGRTLKAAKALDPADAGSRERLRRRLRRLRTAVDFFRGLFPPDAVRAYAGPADQVRAVLDAQHDADVARDRLIRDAVGSGQAKPARQAALDRLAQEDKRRHASLPAAVKALRTAPVFWEPAPR